MIYFKKNKVAGHFQDNMSLIIESKIQNSSSTLIIQICAAVVLH